VAGVASDDVARAPAEDEERVGDVDDEDVGRIVEVAGLDREQRLDPVLSPVTRRRGRAAHHTVLQSSHCVSSGQARAGGTRSLPGLSCRSRHEPDAIAEVERWLATHQGDR
jgi:hypothetical protein